MQQIPLPQLGLPLSGNLCEPDQQFFRKPAAVGSARLKFDFVPVFQSSGEYVDGSGFRIDAAVIQLVDETIEFVVSNEIGNVGDEDFLELLLCPIGGQDDVAVKIHDKSRIFKLAR